MIELTIPMPPSINAMYINRPHGQKGRGRILSSVARAFKDEVGMLTRSELNTGSDFCFSESDEFGLIILMYTTRANRDVSNIIKITEDAIFDAAGVNDSRDMTIIVHKERCEQDYCIVYFGLERDIVAKACVIL